MSEETSRRRFLAAGAGAAGVAAVSTVGITSGAALAGETRRSTTSAQETVVAYIEDHHSSELRLMVGEREVVVHDRDLVHRILNAAGGR